MSTTKHYHIFSQGLSVIRESHDDVGDWYPPVIIPYYWKDGALWVCISCLELGYDKACPINASQRWPNHTDFFITRGVMLFGYAKVNGYIPIYLEELQGLDAILF